MKKKYEAPASTVVALLHKESLLISFSDRSVSSVSEIRSNDKDWGDSDIEEDE